MGRARARARQGKDAKLRPRKNPPKGTGPPASAVGLRPARVAGGFALGALWGVGMWILTLVLGADPVIAVLIFFVVAASLVAGTTTAMVEAANARKRGVPIFARPSSRRHP